MTKRKVFGNGWFWVSVVLFVAGVALVLEVDKLRQDLVDANHKAARLRMAWVAGWRKDQIRPID